MKNKNKTIIKVSSTDLLYVKLANGRFTKLSDNCVFGMSAQVDVSVFDFDFSVQQISPTDISLDGLFFARGFLRMGELFNKRTTGVFKVRQSGTECTFSAYVTTLGMGPGEDKRIEGTFKLKLSGKIKVLK